MQINRKWILTKTLIVLLFLLSPLVEGFFIRGLDRYNIHQEQIQKLNYIGETIYNNGPPIDFLFLGPSSMWASVNAGIIQKELRQINKNETITVENFGHNHIGTDLDFIILKDVIQKRGVKTLFLGIPPIRQKHVHRSMRYLWNPLSDNLDIKTYASLYSEKLLDSIPNLLRYTFLPPRPRPQIVSAIRSRKGSLILTREYIDEKERIPFKHLEHEPLKLKLNDVLMKADSNSLRPIMDFLPYQEQFLKKIIDLSAEKNIRLFILFPPTAITDLEEGSTKFKLLTFQGNKLPPVNYIGLHMKTMFPQGDLKEVKKFYFDTTHTNRNGSEYFTRSLIQPLQEIYETTNH